MKIIDKGLKFILESDKDLPESLLLDETRVRQVLINLLGNATKFTENGHISLSASSSPTDDQMRSRVDLTLTVEDTGVGIPSDQQLLIFDAFEQAVNRKVSRVGGTGLGLAISRNLAEMMNGEISVFSEPGKGSIFRVIFYEVEVAASLSKEEKAGKILDFSTVIFEPATILIGDDIEYNREVLSTYLEGWGFKILFASDGKEALDQARKHHPDLILLDMKMPVMDGYEACEIMNKDEKLKEIPVVAVTASAMLQSEEMISEICAGYLRKPVSRTVLIREVMKHLSHTVKAIKGEIPSGEAILSGKMIFPPFVQISKILDAANSGNVTSLRLSLKEIKEMDVKYHPFVEKMEVWGRKFQFEEIVEFLEKNSGEAE